MIDEIVIIKDTIRKMNDEAYNKGFNDAWELARKIHSTDCATLQKVFGSSDEGTIIMLNSPQVTLERFEAYEKEQAQIKVGDVVETGGIIGVVTAKYPDADGEAVNILKDDGLFGMSYSVKTLKKTGKHIDIQKILEQIAGD